jgi:hypothetical protein
MSAGQPPSTPSGTPPPQSRDHRAAPGNASTATQPTGRPARRVDLLGAWSLVSYAVSDPTVEGDHPLGTGAVGMLIYSPEGYMSAQLVNPHHRAEHSPAAGTDPITAAGHLAYSGPFTVDGTTGLIAHRLLVSSRPDWLHTNQHRTGILRQDQLTLSFTGPDQAGQDRTSVLTWKRLDPQTPR